MLEAMATAKPIVVTQSGGMPEIIHSDVNGYVVPKRDHEALAEKIIKLLDNKELRQKLGQTGRAEVECMYTKKIYARNIFNVYDQAVKEYSKTKKKKVRSKRKIILPREELRI